MPGEAGVINVTVASGTMFKEGDSQFTIPGSRSQIPLLTSDPSSPRFKGIGFPVSRCRKYCAGGTNNWKTNPVHDLHGTTGGSQISGDEERIPRRCKRFRGRQWLKIRIKNAWRMKHERLCFAAWRCWVEVQG